MSTRDDGVQVILVDEADAPQGLCDKLEAHQRVLLHRAVSVFAFDASGQLLIQQRATGKYHSGGLWSNSSCTHPRSGESNEVAARRSLEEELGLAATDWRYAFPFLYRAQVGEGLVEHEYDHVFVCRVWGAPTPDADEVSATAFTHPATIRSAMHQHPELYSPWFRLLLEPVARWCESNPSSAT